jgi:hypothetical protein
LRRHLLDTARSEDWRTEELAAAVRDAGVDPANFKREYSNRDRWWDAMPRL